MIKEYKDIKSGWYEGVKGAPLSDIADSLLKNYGNGDRKKRDGEGLGLICDIIRYTDTHTIMNAVIAVRPMVEVFKPYVYLENKRKSKPIERFVLTPRQETYAFEEGQRFIRFKDSGDVEGIRDVSNCLSDLSKIADKLYNNPENCNPKGKILFSDEKFVKPYDGEEPRLVSFAECIDLIERGASNSTMYNREELAGEVAKYLIERTFGVYSGNEGHVMIPEINIFGSHYVGGTPSDRVVVDRASMKRLLEQRVDSPCWTPRETPIVSNLTFAEFAKRAHKVSLER